QIEQRGQMAPLGVAEAATHRAHRATPTRGGDGRLLGAAEHPAETATARPARRERQSDALGTRDLDAEQVARDDRRAEPDIGEPTGSPEAVKPTGTVAAGWPVRLNRYVNGIQPRADAGQPPISSTPPRPASNGATATVGVINKSKRARKRCTSVQRSWRANV